MPSAVEIAAALSLPTPTPEQVRVIEAPLEGVYRVIAGAGSGKTETMAQRVLWLVANSLVSPHGVLGLTFTKKAAGELSHRMTQRLAELARLGMAGPADEFAAPTVATYNSFAARLYRDHAVLLGRDPDATVLSEASAWSLARSVVGASELEALGSWDISPESLTKIVRVLGQRVAENAVSLEEIDSFASSFASLADLPTGGRGSYAEVDKWVDSIGSLVPLMQLVEEYQRAKQVRGVLEFSDQIALALLLVERYPHIAVSIKADYQVVLLDEYQDTSVAQTSLLASLFASHGVMAVGDPHQAIYGWRGASSANLSEFAQRFGGEATTFSLSTSWRNGHKILDAANEVATVLRELPGVPVMTLGASPTASDEPIWSVFSETIEEEAASVAAWFAQELSGDHARRSAAMIFRSRTHQGLFVEALREKGVPVHVLGLGGLLEDPAIADIVCTLRVLAHPQAETELVRLLSGAKWRLGVSDLHALAQTARWLQGRDGSGEALSPDVHERLWRSVAPMDHAGLLDALSFIAHAPPAHHQLQKYSSLGIERIIDIDRTLNLLQAQRFGDVAELVVAIEKALDLDIEVLSHPQRQASLIAREAFMEALSSYRSVSDDASVVGFVSWLREAEHRDNLTPRAEKPEEGCVQILTIHGAKGLEWDLVAIPRLVDEELPSKPREVKAWLNRGELPYLFRGDSGSLPVFRWEAATTRKEAIELGQDFQDQVREHRLREERRLMYVGVTRAKHLVALSGSWWAHQQTPRGPSPFLSELAQAGLVPALPEAPASDVPPVRESADDQRWPRDPLGSRRPTLEAAAKAVTDALEQEPGTPAHDPLVTRFLEESQRRHQGELEPVLEVPIRIPASSLERWVSDPESVLASLARPIPHKPHRAALRGTLFHRFVEEKYQTTFAQPLMSVDDADADPVEELSLTDWKTAFEASEFAAQTPLAIEVELHLPLAGHLIICKIDAVFPQGSGAHIVDWKTGKEPGSKEDLAAKSLQLAAYRLAWSQWSGMKLDDITASFWFVATQKLVTPDALPDKAQCEALLSQALPARKD